MAALSHPDSRRKYSWWWDSHISPKNSKWLQENLTDMDAKVKQMIKLLEEDADSFARRAEMYYKKRPELMKLVEEFYRAYRALAERYDHATGALRQAHRTMAEAFPNQVPFDDSPAGSSASENDPQTPEMSPMIRSIFYPDELQKDALGLSPSAFNVFKRNGAFTEEPTVTSRKTLKEPNDSFGEGKARKGLNFQDEEEKEQSTQNNGSEHISAQVLSQSEQLGKAETEILTLKETLAKFEAEKEAVLLQYQQSLEKSSALESEVSSAHKDSKGFSQRASQAEAEVQTLKEALSKLQSERDASVLQYQQCMEMISKLEDEVSHARKDAGELNERASKTEVEAKAIRQDLVTVEAEKEAAHAQYNQCLEIISNLEEKLLHAEENARMTSERADKAETKVEILRQELARLTEEKEAAALQYLQCLETIADLKHKISYAQEEAQRLTCEIDDGVVKLKGAEERCFLLEKSNQTLQSELESLVEKMGSQSEELSEKQKELGRLWSCIQEERLRFVEAETAFQTLQHLHAESQEELRSLGEELQNRTQILKEMETCNQGLEDEVQRAKEENKSLNELNLSSVVSIKNLQDEILSLRETIRKLEEEVELRVDQRNALQQEIYCLREELNELNKKHLTVMDQVESVGYDSECFGSSVKDLQVENSKLKEMCEAESSDKVLLLEKLEIMEKLLEKNVVLENSLSDLHVELEGVKEKVKTLEESCQTLLGDKSALVDEKATLISQLQSTAANLEKLSEKNNFLENSLFDANAELEVLRIKSESLEDSYMLLDMEKSGLVTERESLFSQLDVTKQRLEDLEKSFSELEHKHSDLENERECSLRKVEELQASLDAAQQEHASFSSSSEKRLASMELQIHVLEEEGQCRKKEYEEQQDKTFSAQIEIFILQKSVHDLEKKIVSLLIECQNLLEASKLSGKLISELEHENLEQQVKLKSLFGQMKNLRMGLYQVLKTLEIDADHMFENKINQDEALLRHILSKLQETQNSISRSYDENQQLLIEKSVLVTLLGQLKVDAVNVVTERDNLAGEFKIRSEQFSELQMEIQNLLGMNEKWRLKVMEGDHRIEELITETENMRGQLMDLQRANQNLQEDYFKVLGEKKSVMKEAFDLVGEKSDLEEANWVLFGEIMSQCNISLIFNNMVTEKFAELKELTEELDKLRCINNDLEEKERLMVGKLEDVQTENLNLKESLNESENEFASLKSISDQLRFEIAHGKDLLSRKENELLEAEQIFGATANEKRQLHKLVEDLKDKYDEAKLIIKDQEKQILKLSANNDDQSKEMGCVREVNQKLESDLCRLCEELRSATIREESLNSEMRKGTEEIKLWESQAAAFFAELQISSVREVLFEGRIHDLAIACESLENRSNCKDTEIVLLKERVSTLEGEKEGLEESLNSEMQKGTEEIKLWESQAAAFFAELQISSVREVLFEGRIHELTIACESLENRSNCKDTEIELLKERVSTLEGENRGLQAHLAAYTPAVISVKHSVSSLEKHTLFHSRLSAVENEKAKDVLLVTRPHAEIYQHMDENGITMVPDEFSDLQDLQRRVEAIEKAVVEMERLAMLEQLNANGKLEAAMREIEELKLQSHSRQENVQARKHVTPHQPEGKRVHDNGPSQGMQTREVSDARNEVLTKDIMLDQISECSSYGISRRETAEADQMLELWETTDRDGSIDPMVGKGQKGATAQPHNQIEPVKEHKPARTPSESLLEKELAVDKLEISGRLTEPRQRGNKRKILERLDSDAQKLTNLQITVEDLKRKVENTEKSRKDKGVQCDTIKGQLGEAEESITKLFDVNRKLIKTVESSSLSFDGVSALDSDESVNARRKFSDEAQRGSEKIGQLQLEVQKVQFLLLKLDDEKETQGKTRITDRKPKVLLRDYLYGGLRTNQKRKKTTFCACVRPPTNGD
ncbi:hypothetical protein I3842_07G090800 [Carya illinoinensis]|uniref:NAB domain-containing protein n=1 Tax=Carya illinoinensis TaxID=32201 RepID=A0A922EIJ6_CARIL|nr:hypothetical protein I3842_07G090800 [Carya illinoinensis]